MFYLSFVFNDVMACKVIDYGLFRICIRAVCRLILVTKTADVTNQSSANVELQCIGKQF